MKSPLQILHLEDNSNDAALVEATLAAAGMECAITHAQNQNDFLAALERGGFDLILSDWSLPAFDGLSALKIAHNKCPGVPVILVSGTLGEEQAIDSFKNGATDYVLKQRLARLVPAVRRAMLEVEAHNECEQNEKTIRGERNFSEAALNSMPGIFYLFDQKGHFVRWNKNFERISCYTPGEIARMNPLDFIPKDERGNVAKIIEQIYAEGDASIEAHFMSKDGKCIPYYFSGQRIQMEGRLFLIGTGVDISKRKQLEAQFIEVQKMEVIGQLASGVAHDFNNVIGVIMGYSGLIKSDVAPDSLLSRYADEIRHASERAVGLTRQLLVFSRKQTVQLVVLDLNDVLKDMDTMLVRLVDENIIVKFVPAQNLGRIKADSGYIGQVLMNLVVNARDAMPNGGKLQIATGNVTLDEKYAVTHPGTVPGNYVTLSVSDTGIGMTEKVKAHLFEAFFTTKPKGKGTGLGLATCQTIVQLSKGHIDVESEPGKGATFRIYFPQIEQPLDAAAEPIQTGPVPRGTETLLLVEDEPSVRHLASSILEAQGYTVLRANNGQDALHVVHAHTGSPIRLVVTDVIMPLMGGKVMAEWLKTTYPDLKILYTSGYTDDAIARHGVLENGIAFLPKPYTPATLARKVRAMLDNTSETTLFRKQSTTINQNP